MRERLLQESGFEGLRHERTRGAGGSLCDSGKVSWDPATDEKMHRQKQETRPWRRQGSYSAGCSDFEGREAGSLEPISRQISCSVQHCVPGRTGFKGKWKLRVFECMRWWIRPPQVRRDGWDSHPRAIFWIFKQQEYFKCHSTGEGTGGIPPTLQPAMGHTHRDHQQPT